MSGLSFLFLLSVMNMFFGSLMVFKVLTPTKWLSSSVCIMLFV